MALRQEPLSGKRRGPIQEMRRRRRGRRFVGPGPRRVRRLAETALMVAALLKYLFTRAVVVELF
jgi:hypothetical protein